MAAFLAQKMKLLAALKDEGGLFECRFLARLIERERVGVQTAATAADEIKVTVSSIRQKFLRDIAADDDTPNVVDAKEQAELLEDLSKLGVETRHHAGQLQQLT